MIDCPCGCLGNIDGENCTYSNDGRTTQEALCSGSGVSNVDQLATVWAANNCPQVYTDILYDTGEYNRCNLSRVQADVNNLFDTYLDFGFEFTDDPASSEFNNFQTTLTDLCNNPAVPGGCDLFLTNYCSGFTRTEILQDRALSRLCGCYAPPIFSTDIIPAQCDPLCNVSSVINGIQQTPGTAVVQKYDPCTGDPITCDSDVCVISNENVAGRSKVVGTTIFQQICPNCNVSKGRPCQCYIAGVDLPNVLDNAQVGSTYRFYCGNTSQCFQERLDGKLVQVECPDSTDFTPPPTGTGLFIIVIALILVIGLIIALCMILNRTTSNDPKRYVPHYTVIKQSVT